ncbi:condensin complex subunit 2/barren [Parasitella parasitica]|nr:condensin complex subunit 2/barren [Parasitella parasitica]
MQRGPLSSSNSRSQTHGRASKRSLSSTHSGSTSNNNSSSSNNNSNNNSTGTTLSVQPSVPTLTPAQMYSNFEEWIKICTDNKVNVSNTWNFALIDYFHEMTFIREGDSINFQKASCTLDGCVKIYTSRVDSVANETGKLLSGLADSTHTDGGDDENRQERRVRRKTMRSDTTLLKDFSALAIKKFDLDFSVDPLFKKTSADFDEGGARGLLLNHLSLDQNCKIIFDASDATVECDVEDANNEQIIMSIEHIESDEPVDPDDDMEDEQVNCSEDDDEDAQAKADSAEQGQANTPTREELDTIKEDGSNTADGDKSTAETMNTEDSATVQESPSVLVEGETVKENSPVAQVSEESRVEIYRLKAKLPSFDDLPGFHIVPFLNGFDFFSDDTTLAIPDLDNEDDVEEAMMDIAREMSVAPDAFQYDDYEIDYGMDDVDPFADPMDEQHYPENEAATPHEIEHDSLKYPENDFLSALIHNGDQEMLNYFDTTLVKNWAGPEHWKLRRTVEKKPAPTAVSNDADRNDKTKKSAAKKPVSEFVLPFDEILKNYDDIDDDKVFEQAVRKPALGRDALNKMPDNILPDDIHFSSKLLLRYSLKPIFPMGPRKMKSKQQTATISNGAPQDNGGIPDADFWAGQNQGFDDEMFDYGMDYGDDMDMPTDTYDANDQTILTAFEDTTFYNDDNDDNEHSTLYGDELITNHHLKKTKPLYVNYARTAKRVDVKKLKDNLWKVLTNNELHEEKVHGQLKFTDIVHDLKKLYSPKTMRDISVPFCFICLLHLANEKDLSISGMGAQYQDDDDFVLGDDNNWMSNETILNEVTIVQN